MKIAIIGGGFTGLSAAYYLSKNGHKITLFEKSKVPGGLGSGFKQYKWLWTLEKHYHHWFANDKTALALARELNCPVEILKPKTSVYIGDEFYKLDSPFDVMKFTKLNICQRLRMGIILGVLKYNPFWKIFEKHKASELLPILMGQKAYKCLWEPLLMKKFRKYYKEISLTWFWARIKKRTACLAYPSEGFFSFAKNLISKIESRDGKIYYNSEIKNIVLEKNNKIKIKNQEFDKVIVTIPSQIFAKIAPTLPSYYKQKLLKQRNLGAINLILCLKEKFLKDNTYWLNICDPKSKITGIIEHTNFIKNSYYDNEHIVYILNYVQRNDKLIHSKKEDLLKRYESQLKKINPDYKKNIIDTFLFRDFYAQPVYSVNYLASLPQLETPIKNLYLANMGQVYPWDRGTNYAIELGKKIADFICKNERS